jgi:uncharacterized integral membrane protein (TIGR00698 family)
MDQIRLHLSGIFLCTVTAALAMMVAAQSKAVGAATLAILAGVTITNSFKLPAKLKPGVAICEKRMLEFAVVLMGLQLQFDLLVQAGRIALITIAAAIGSAFVVTWFICRFSKKHKVAAIFLGMGTAICGSSAIAATTPLFPEHKDTAAFSIGTINLLGIFGLFCLPLLAAGLGFGAEETAALIGGSLQAVGHVAAAAMPLGEGVSQLAIPIKMGRVAMLAPTLIVMVYFFRSNRTSLQPKPGLKLPWYLYGFVLTALLGLMELLPQSINNGLNKTGDLLLNIAMVAIGLQLRLANIKDKLSSTMLIACAVWIAQITILLAVLLFGI